MNLGVIADEIHFELNAPTDLSVGFITLWLRANVGKLNNLLQTKYVIDSTTGEASPELGIEEKDIFKSLYSVYYYDILMRRFLASSGTDSILRVDSDGASVTKVNKTELGKTYMQAKNTAQASLNSLINAYKVRGGDPIQVAGDDTFSVDAVPESVRIRY